MNRLSAGRFTFSRKSTIVSRVAKGKKEVRRLLRLACCGENGLSPAVSSRFG